MTEKQTVDDVLLNKVAIIERCLQRINEEYQGNQAELLSNFTKQDSVILNLQRLCEASIDMANRYLKLTGAPVPQSSRDGFVQLEKLGILTPELASDLQKMVGFRNVAVHDYQNLNLDILLWVLDNKLLGFSQFAKALLQAPTE